MVQVVLSTLLHQLPIVLLLLYHLFLTLLELLRCHLVVLRLQPKLSCLVISQQDKMIGSRCHTPTGQGD